MNILTHVENQAFIQSCQTTFGSGLVAMFYGDNYVRASDFTFAYANHFILVLGRVGKEELDKARVILADFPDYFIHVVSRTEIEQYPRHGLWQFASRVPILGIYPKSLADLDNSTIFAGIQHSVAETSHIVRRHFLSPRGLWNTIWSVRFCEWVVKVVDLGIIRLWHYLITGTYPEYMQDIRNTFERSSPGGRVLNYIANWPQEKKRLLGDQNELDIFLLDLNELLEFYTKLIADRFPSFSIKYSDKKIEAGQNDSLFVEFAKVLEQLMKDNLLMLLLSGSQARGEAQHHSDVDTIAVFEIVNSETLVKLRTTLTEFPGFSSYILSNNGFRVYPSYRRHTFLYGCRYLAGQMIPNMSFDTMDLLDGIRHTLLVIAQISREYYVRGSYSNRAIASVRWQAKMADFGCLRLLPLLKGERYLDSRIEVQEYFSNDENILRLLDLLTNPSEWRERLQCELSNGSRDTLDQLLLTVNYFVQNQLDHLEGANYGE